MKRERKWGRGRDKECLRKELMWKAVSERRIDVNVSRQWLRNDCGRDCGKHVDISISWLRFESRYNRRSHFQSRIIPNLGKCINLLEIFLEIWNSSQPSASEIIIWYYWHNWHIPSALFDPLQCAGIVHVLLQWAIYVLKMLQLRSFFAFVKRAIRQWLTCVKEEHMKIEDGASVFMMITVRRISAHAYNSCPFPMRSTPLLNSIYYY